MRTPAAQTEDQANAAALIRALIERGGERLWRHQDFEQLPSTAIAQALSRLSRQGELERLSKGIYYRPRQTAFGKSRPNPAALRELIASKHKLFPAGLSAANLLGFTTQNPRRREIATAARSLPRKLLGPNTIVYTRRPAAWNQLSESEAALLDFLRDRGESSEFSSEETTRMLLELLSRKGRFENLLKAASTEPPRVRAMLGAIGEQLGKKPKKLQALKEGMNPLSRFDFGLLSPLEHADKWQAKERAAHETMRAS